MLVDENQWDSTIPATDAQGNARMPPRINSLAGFTNLKSIVAYSSLLMRRNGDKIYSLDSLVDILPVLLQRLEIKGCRLGVMHQIPEIVARKSTRLPNLQIITLEYFLSCRDGWKQFFESVDHRRIVGYQMMCKNVGVALEFQLRRTEYTTIL